MITIRLFTVDYRPGHTVTLRGNILDDWKEDLPGLYLEGAWIFKIPYQNPQGGIQVKFMLDRQYWQSGAANLVIPAIDGLVFDVQQQQVDFPFTSEIVAENARVQRHLLKPNLDGNVVYDAIVIGSGMGGGIVAEQLADFGKKVLVLEAGSYLFPTHVANLPRRQKLGAFDKHLWQMWPDFQVKNFKDPAGHAYKGAAGFHLGGRSLFWGGIIPRPAWWELDAWPLALRHDLEDVYFAKAEDLMKLSRAPSSYQNRVQRWFTREYPDLHVQTAPMAVQVGDGEARTLSAGVFDTASLLMESVMTGDTDLTINLNHAANKILTANGRATGVVAYDLISRQERTYLANTVILAAGSVESPKLAQLSGLNDPSGLVGKGFTDHQIFFTHFGLPNTHELYQTNASAKLTARRTVQVGNQAHRFLMIVELGADFNQGRYIDPDMAAEHAQQLGNSMLCEIVFLCESPLLDQNAVIQNQPSWEDATIQMVRSTAANGIKPELEQLKNSILQKLGAVVLPNDNHFLNEADLGGVAHEVGTLRLGDANSVVDADLKFRGYQNLYCCDMSVLPNSPAANPSLTLAALALRLADHLR